MSPSVCLDISENIKIFGPKRIRTPKSPHRILVTLPTTLLWQVGILSPSTESSVANGRDNGWTVSKQKIVSPFVYLAQTFCSLVAMLNMCTGHHIIINVQRSLCKVPVILVTC